MKIFIWTDLEGVNGVVSPEQTDWRSKKEPYAQACRNLTAEVNAAASAAFDAGAKEVVVWDGHGQGFNLRLDEIHPDVKAIVSGGGRIRWIPVLDKSFDAMVMLGCHAKAGTPRAILEHTQSPDEWFEYRLNNVVMGEVGQAAVIAGSFGVPVAFLSGDRAACREAVKLLGPIETASVKEGLSRTSGLLMAPAAALKLISEGVTRAMARLKSFKPYRTKWPARVRVVGQTAGVADRWERSGWKRLDGRTVEFMAANIDQIIPY